MCERAKGMHVLSQSALKHERMRLCKWVIGTVRGLPEQRARRLQDQPSIKQLRHSLESFSISNAHLQLTSAYQQHPRRVHFAEPLEKRGESKGATAIEDIPSTPIVIQEDDSASSSQMQTKPSISNQTQMSTSYSSIFTMLSDMSPSAIDFNKTFNLGGARFEDDSRHGDGQLGDALDKFETPKRTPSETTTTTTYGGLGAIYEV